MEKKAHVGHADNLRRLVSIINENNICREDIVYITKDAGTYIMLYFK